MLGLGAIVVGAALAAACSSGDGGGGSTAQSTSAAVDGQGSFAIGEIKRLPGGTAVPTDARTLVDATCSDGRLVLRTDRESVFGQMDCAQMIPPPTLVKFRGKQVAISYRAQRLRIESATEGTVEFTVTNATIGTGDVAP
jgi:hypothetical protein